MYNPEWLLSFTNQSLVGLPGLALLQKRMDMGIFGNEHNAEGIPVQPGQRMKGPLLPRPGIVALYKIGKGSRDSVPGGVDQHSGRLIHRQKPIILKKHCKRPLLCRILRLRLFQTHCNNVSRLYLVIRMAAEAIDPEAVRPRCGRAI